MGVCEPEHSCPRSADRPRDGLAGAAFDQNGNGNADPVLTRRVDRNRDGRPDLLITNDSVDVGRILGLPSQFALVFAIAPFALGAGYITGRAGLSCSPAACCVLPARTDDVRLRLAARDSDGRPARGMFSLVSTGRWVSACFWAAR